MQRTILHLLVTIAVAGSACGSDDDKSPEVSTGLPAEAKLSDLEESDAPALCEAIEAGIDEVFPESEVKRLTCTLVAVASMNIGNESSEMLNVDVDMCEDFVAECVSSKDTDAEEDFELGALTSETQCDSAAAAAKIGECDATVAEYEACLDSALQAFATFRDAIRCSAFEDQEMLRETFAMPDPSQSEGCKALETKCSGLFDGLSGAEEDESSN